MFEARSKTCLYTRCSASQTLFGVDVDGAAWRH